MEEPIISLQGIKKNYGNHPVLTSVDLTVNRGDIFGVVGKNGAGKTTMFKIILGLSDSNGGILRIGNVGQGAPSKSELAAGREKIGFFVGFNFFPYLTGRQNLEYYRTLKRIRDKGEVDRVLKIVELDKAKGHVKGYSMGMRQRLGIANAMLGSPEILILDEPTNGLDPQGIADIRQLLKKLNEEHGITVIVSSHILGELQNTAHRFAIIHNGTVVKVITQEDLAAQNKVVQLSVDDLPRAKQVLAEAGIQVLGEVQNSRSLEEYYFQLVGGEKQ